MSNIEDPDQETVGYRRPPRRTQFRKGRSGNPKGRPRGRHVRPPYDTVLGQMVTVRDGGVERQVTAAEAFLMYMSQDGLAGNDASARVVMDAIEKARAARSDNPSGHPDVTIHFISQGSVTCALEALRMARIHDRYNQTNARVVLEPWLVEAALDRLADRQLTVEEQKIVFAATRTPRKVTWPAWWSVSA